MTSNANKNIEIQPRKVGNYEKTIIKEVVKLVEEGMSRRRACEQYGMAKRTLRYGLDQYRSAAYQMGKQNRLTALQKRTVVCAIERGSMTVREAGIAYQIKKGRHN